MWHKRYRIKGFTLLESLLVLVVISFLTLALSGSVTSSFKAVEEKLFFLNFEQLYLDCQKLSSSQQEPVELYVTSHYISNGYQQLTLPSTVQVLEGQVIEFSANGGNSSLSKLQFQTASVQVTYQLQLGSGKYKKTIQRLHSP